jgi:polysaccharide deacetylase 2 family uncharacterized protein YibQ
MQRVLRTSNRRIHPTASRFKLQDRLLLALALSVVLLILTFVLFDQDYAAVEQRPETLPGAPVHAVQGWAGEFENLMAAKYFSPEWVKGLGEFGQARSADQDIVSLSLRYPTGYRIHDFISGIINISDVQDFDIVESYENLNPRGFGLAFSTDQGDVIQLKFREDAKLEWLSGKIAIIIDDFGYRLDEVLETFLNLSEPITIAVIPGTEFSKQVAERAREAGKDVIIHLPMEPLKEKVENDGYTVFTGMSQDEIDAVVGRALKDVPAAIGINNHMGSKATADRETMSRLMQSLQKHDLLFVDSITNRSSVAYQEARRKDLGALKLTTYLDNEENPASIAEVLSNTVTHLPELDPAVLIGHPREQTSRLLPAEMKRWAAKGISFVSIRDLLENP